MRIFFILPIFLICSLYGQDYVLLRDEFNKSQEMWDLRQGHFTLEEGRLRLSRTELRGRQIHAMEQFLDRREDYTISADFTPLTAKESATYGFIWGGNEDLSSYFAFEVNAMRFARVIEVDEGNLRVLHPWKKHRKIKGLGEEHLLEMKKVGRGAYFFVNNKELFRIDFPRIHGFYQGIHIFGACEVDFDAFMILHSPIRFPEMGSTWPEAVRLHLDTTINTEAEETHPFFHPYKMQFFFSRDGRATETHMSDSGWTAGSFLSSSFSSPTKVVHAEVREQAFLMADQMASLQWMKQNQEGWIEAQRFPLPPIPSQKHPIDWTFSPDGKVMIFSARLQDSYGEEDLYVCFREGEYWTDPVNLGPSVNTFAREYSPYLAEDLKTLTFGTNGKAGYGKGDLYQTERRSRTWTKWSTAKNLGSGINTPRWDRDFYPHPRERRTYFLASQDSHRGDYDLFRIKIPIDLQAQPLVKVSGNIYLEGSQTLLNAEVQAWRIGGGIDKEGSMESQEGSYGMLLPLGEAYQIYPIKVGYYPIIDTLDARPFTSFREIRRDLYLKKLEVGVIVTLQQVFFKRAKAELLPESFPELSRLVSLMQSRPNMKIEIHGHTDNIGEAAELKDLSERRAERVRSYLINNRISPDRLIAKGFGPDRPIAPNENPITRALNRRVEFLILQQ